MTDRCKSLYRGEHQQLLCCQATQPFFCVCRPQSEFTLFIHHSLFCSFILLFNLEEVADIFDLSSLILVHDVSDTCCGVTCNYQLYEQDANCLTGIYWLASVQFSTLAVCECLNTKRLLISHYEHRAYFNPHLPPFENVML